MSRAGRALVIGSVCALLVGACSAVPDVRFEDVNTGDAAADARAEGGTDAGAPPDCGPNLPPGAICCPTGVVCGNCTSVAECSRCPSTCGTGVCCHLNGNRFGCQQGC